jgi:transmembrane sensor
MVRAIGTEFNVDEQSDRTVVTVLKGQVAVTKSLASTDGVDRRELLRELAGPVNKRQAVLVSAGEQVTVLAKNMPPPNAVDVRAVTAWMQQRLVFDNTPLSEVAEEFNLYSKRRLVIADTSLRNVGVTGEYSASAPDALVGFLRSQPSLHIVETDDRVFVTRSTGH